MRHESTREDGALDLLERPPVPQARDNDAPVDRPEQAQEADECHMEPVHEHDRQRDECEGCDARVGGHAELSTGSDQTQQNNSNNKNKIATVEPKQHQK